MASLSIALSLNSTSALQRKRVKWRNSLGSQFRKFLGSWKMSLGDIRLVTGMGFWPPCTWHPETLTCKLRSEESTAKSLDMDEDSQGGTWHPMQCSQDLCQREWVLSLCAIGKSGGQSQVVCLRAHSWKVLTAAFTSAPASCCRDEGKPRLIRPG